MLFNLLTILQYFRSLCDYNKPRPITTGINAEGQYNWIFSAQYLLCLANIITSVEPNDAGTTQHSLA
jgi:hypothetical protein